MTSKTVRIPVTTESTTSDDGQNSSTWIIIAVSVSVVVSLIIAFILFFVIASRKRANAASTKAKDPEQHQQQDAKVEQKDDHNVFVINKPRVNKWEIDRSMVIVDLSRNIGKGAFGSVHLGRLLTRVAGDRISFIEVLNEDPNVVAVKMMRESTDHSSEIEFIREINVMKAIGYHDRLVNMIACVTSSPSLLILEYCSNGDLLRFMRNRMQTMRTIGIDYPSGITKKQQIQFALEIASGLEYLSQRGYVHRDLAARNVLVDRYETCKIGDFGLCRRIGDVDVNYQARGGGMPIKWMSPEAINGHSFSTASDIWSFGIVLFEIITLGGSPYPTWPTPEVIHRLNAGQRMQRPACCSDNMYTLMSLCWAYNPVRRPTFSEIRRYLTKELNDVAHDNCYVSIDSRADYYKDYSDTIRTRQLGSSVHSSRR